MPPSSCEAELLNCHQAAKLAVGNGKEALGGGGGVDRPADEHGGARRRGGIVPVPKGPFPAFTLGTASIRMGMYVVFIYPLIYIHTGMAGSLFKIRSMRYLGDLEGSPGIPDTFVIH